MEVRKLREWNETETRERFMKLKGGKGYTLADIEALPEGERAELIDGQIYMMAPPNRKHQTIARELFSSINYYI